jgi:hypothetical protein
MSKSSRLLTVSFFMMWLLFILAFLFSACTDPIAENELQGEWRAIDVQPKDSLEKIDLSAVKLQMDGSNFIYQKSRKDVFKGEFILRDHLLTLMPSSGPDTAHVQLGVFLLGSDTLLLRMNRNGRETQLLMARDSL